MIADRSIGRNDALGTPQFYLLWAILFINVTAGIGILSQTSPMLQDMFHKTAVEAGTMVFVISLFNAGGRFLWASGSDYIGRRNTYTLFFVVQVALFLLIPVMAAQGSWGLFLTSLFIVFTMYGGGFATIPPFWRIFSAGECRRDSWRGANRLERRGGGGSDHHHQPLQ